MTKILRLRNTTLSSNSEAIIDWLSFSLPVYAPVKNEVDATVFAELAYYLPDLTANMIDWEWIETSGRAPYDRSYTCSGFRIFAGVGVPHIAIEVSGRGCKLMREMNMFFYVLSIVHDRVSRIDVALDIETDVAPSDFVDEGYSGRIRSVGRIKSDSGETVYVGSQKSDRYCRVYRYESPHERSHLLRIEYVFRRKEAKIVALEISKDGVASVAARANCTYKWEHGLMDELKDVSGLTASVAHRTKAKTLRWLIKQVAPAFRGLVADGVIENPSEFLQVHFLTKGGQDEG